MNTLADKNGNNNKQPPFRDRAHGVSWGVSVTSRQNQWNCEAAIEGSNPAFLHEVARLWLVSLLGKLERLEREDWAQIPTITVSKKSKSFPCTALSYFLLAKNLPTSQWPHCSSSAWYKHCAVAQKPGAFAWRLGAFIPDGRSIWHNANKWGHHGASNRSNPTWTSHRHLIHAGDHFNWNLGVPSPHTLGRLYPVEPPQQTIWEMKLARVPSYFEGWPFNIPAQAVQRANIMHPKN